MKTIFTELFIFLIAINAQSQSLELPFYEDFEESITNDAIFENWSTEDLEGWQHWHLIPWGGFGGGQCVRFENNDLNQNDWLITNPINTEDADSLVIHFYSFYNFQGTKPELLYTTAYSGDAQNDVWSEIEYDLGESTESWHHSGEINIKAPESEIWFAFHSNQEANNGILFLLDNFSVSKYVASPEYELVASTAYFEFYTNMAEETNYWTGISEGLEQSFKKYCDIWNIRGKTDFIDKNLKTKIYYTEKANIPFVNAETPEIKSGFFDLQNNSIYLSPLDTPEKLEYYQSMEGLAINTFAGYAKYHQLYRDQGGFYGLPDYYTEGFGLYEQGFRPRLDSIIRFRSEHPEDLTHEALNDMNVFSRTAQKDIIVSYVEGQIVCLLDYNGTAPYGSFEPIWNNFLIYFYDTTDVVRIKKYASSDNFDIYCSSRDTMFIDRFFEWLEQTQQFYIDSFRLEINRKYNLVIYYDEKTGMDMTGYDNWNGGSGGLNISPHNFPDGIDGFPWLLAHEFGHVYNSVLCPEMPFGFYHEGMANFSGFMQYGSDWAENRPLIESVLYYFLKQFGREPTLNEFITNPYMDEGGNIDPYYFGLEFIRYLYELDGILKLEEFFDKGMDFSVFSQSYDQIEKGYLRRLKMYQHLTFTDTLIELPFNEPFNALSNGWTKPSVLNPDNWNIDDGGINGTSCIRYYTHSDANEPVDSWLVSPALNLEHTDQLQLSFDFARFGEGLELEILYTDRFNGFTDSTSWSLLKSVEMPVDWGWSNTGEITISNLPDTVFVGIRLKTEGEQHLQLYVDNFKAEGVVTHSNLIFDSNFKVYPNPVSYESIISFHTQYHGNVKLTIFDIHGREVCTVFNERMKAGSHSVSVPNILPEGGVYLCVLSTEKNTKTIKFVTK
ncbi:choice-of-anchor J domain-containing protein [Saccharicrinis sp. FJH2]|uniref:choice-of-anchor J domain-containing protein n=1 Tax=Saccharicrinis sp. FJH65 TaxID=3344659 RepID=UPI0035F3FE2A